MARIDYYYDEKAPKPNSIVAAASAIVTNNKGQILLHKRKDNNMWSLLGGAMEAGESISQTIIREVMEESGYNVTIKRMIGVYTDPNHIIEYSNGEIRQQFSICFHCTINSGELRISDESIELKFFSVDEISDLHMHEAQRVRVNDYFENNDQPFIR